MKLSNLMQSKEWMNYNYNMMKIIEYTCMEARPQSYFEIVLEEKSVRGRTSFKISIRTAIRNSKILKMKFKY